MTENKTEQLLALVRREGVVRPRDLSAHGIAREHLARLVERGLLERPARGLYVLARAEAGEHQALIEVCKRVPHAVVCLLSALRFHRMTTQAPFEVWVAIASKARSPKSTYPPLRVIRFAAAILAVGVEVHRIQGVDVRVTTPAATVADCFKFRNKIGLDVALEALRETWRGKRATMDEMYRAARIRRMTSVMRPYLESLV